VDSIESHAEPIQTFPDAPADRGHVHALPLRDFARALLVEVVEEQSGPERLLQREDELNDFPVKLHALDDVEGRRFRSLRARRALFAPPAGAPLRTRPGSEAANHGAEPAAQPRGLPRRAFDGPDQRLLDEVLGQGVVVDQASRQGVHPAGLGQQVRGRDVPSIRHGVHFPVPVIEERAGRRDEKSFSARRPSAAAA
jgi:hypothetical protein